MSIGSMLSSITSPKTTEGYYRFSYVGKTSHGLLKVYYENGDIYAKASQDNGLIWEAVNRGEPILRRGNHYLKNIWNFAFAENSSGSLHALVECSQYADQRDVGLCEGSITFNNLDDVNFNLNMSTTPVIPNAGNPFMAYNSTQNKFIALYGAVHRNDINFDNFWFIKAALKTADTWTESNNFSIGEKGIAVADPHLIEFKDKLLLFVSYNQLDMILLYQPLSMDGFISKYFP